MKSNLFLRLTVFTLFLLVLVSQVSAQDIKQPSCTAASQGFRICTINDDTYDTTTPKIKVNFHETPVDISGAILYIVKDGYTVLPNLEYTNEEHMRYEFTYPSPLPNREYLLLFNATDEDDNVIEMNIKFTVFVDMMAIWVSSPTPSTYTIDKPLFAVSKETPNNKFDIVLELEREGTCEYSTNELPSTYKEDFGTGRFVPFDETNGKFVTIKDYDVLNNHLGQGNNAENSKKELARIYVVCKEDRDDSFAHEMIYVGYDVTPPVINLVATPSTVTDYWMHNTSIKIETDDMSACYIEEKNYPPNENPRFSLDKNIVVDSMSDYDFEVSDEILFTTNTQYSKYTYTFDITCNNLADYQNTESITVYTDLQTTQDITYSSPSPMTNKLSADLNFSAVLTDPDGCKYKIVGPNDQVTEGETGAPVVSSGGVGSKYSKRISLFEGTNTISVECGGMADYGFPYTVIVDSTPPDVLPVIEANMYTCSYDSITARILDGDDNEGGTGFHNYMYNFTNSDATKPEYDLPPGTTGLTPINQKSASISESLSDFDPDEIDGVRYNLMVWAVDNAGNVQSSPTIKPITVSDDGFQFCDFIDPTIDVTKTQDKDTSYWYMIVNCSDEESGCNEAFRYSIHTDTSEECTYNQGSGVLGKSAIEISKSAKFCAIVYDNNNNNDTYSEILSVVQCQTITDNNRASCDFVAPTGTVNKKPVQNGYQINVTCVDNNGGAGCAANFNYKFVEPDEECTFTGLGAYQIDKALPIMTKNKKMCYQVYDKALIPNYKNQTELISAELSIELESPRLGISKEKDFDFIVKTDRPVRCKYGYTGITYDSLEHQYQAFTTFEQTGGTTHKSTLDLSKIPQFKNKMSQPEQNYPWAVMCDESGLYHIKEISKFGYDTTPSSVDISVSVNPITDQGNMKTVLSVNTNDETVCSFNYMNGTNGYFTPYIPSDPDSYKETHSETLYYWNIHEDDDHEVKVSCKNLAQEVSTDSVTIEIRPKYDVDITIYADEFYNSRSQLINVSTNGVGSDCKFRTSPDKAWTNLNPTNEDAVWHTYPSALFEEGENTLEVNCIAKFSQDEATRSKKITIDTVAPTVQIITNTKTCSLTEITANLVSNGTGTNIVKYYYNLSKDTENLVGGESTSQELKIEHAYVVGDVYILTVSAVDEAGNIGYAAAKQITGSTFDSVECDITPPVGTGKVTYLWGGAEVNISCQDADSGCSDYFGYYLSDLSTCSDSYGMLQYAYSNPQFTPTPGRGCFKVYDVNGNYDTGSKKIEFDENCFNYVEDPDEEGVDCGGSCEAECGTCDNGEQDEYELGVDCGGVCETIESCGAPCTSWSDCPTGQVCSEGICIVDHTGDDCSESNPCPDGYYCDDYGSCQLEGGSGCVFNSDCQPGYICNVLGVCELGNSGPECFFDSDCGPGQYCDYLGTCQDNNEGETCTTDADCGNDFICVSGECAPDNNGGPECYFDSDCGSDQYCDYLGTCQDNDYGDSCTTDDDCGADFYCGLDKECHLQNFEPECYFDSDCGDGYYCSIEGSCELDTGGDSCTTDADCGDYFICDNGDCAPDLTDNPDCFFDTDCSPGEYCKIDGTCAEDTTNTGCTSDSDCGDDFYCALDGTCKLDYEGPDCLFDSDCGDGYYCTTDLTCAEDTVGDACTNDVDCGSDDFVCTDGSCELNTGGATECFFDLDCASDEYCSFLGTCEKDATSDDCVVDSDCGDDFYCALDGTCKLKHEGPDCLFDDDCGEGYFCTTNLICQEDTTGDTCTTDGECGVGFICNESMCEIGSSSSLCLFDDECSPGYYCATDGSCKEDTTGNTCTTDDECGDDFICSDGTCQLDTATGGSCFVDEDCGSGKICNAFGMCEDDATGTFCYSDLDCGSSEYFCNEENKCQKDEGGCITKLDCDLGQICSFGQCVKDTQDTDGDGLPDWWEKEHFGDPIIADPVDDPDDDGYTNLEEFKKGSDPNDQFSPDADGGSSGPSLLALILMILGALLILGGSGLLYYEYYKREHDDSYVPPTGGLPRVNGPKSVIDQPKKPKYTPQEIAARERMFAKARREKESKRRNMFDQFSDEKSSGLKRKIVPQPVIKKGTAPPVKQSSPIEQKSVPKNTQTKEVPLVGSEEWNKEFAQKTQSNSPKTQKAPAKNSVKKKIVIDGPRTKDDYIDLTQVKKEKPKKEVDSNKDESKEDVFNRLKKFVDKSKKQ